MKNLKLQSLLFLIPAICLTLYWFDWRLLIIIYAMSWGNNLLLAGTLNEDKNKKQ